MGEGTISRAIDAWLKYMLLVKGFSVTRSVSVVSNSWPNHYIIRGPSIKYYVHTEGGEGGQKIAQFCGQTVLKMQIKG